jgi:hypothetical protein
MKPLFDACRLLIQTHARRLPLIDQDDQTGKEVVLSVLTQYRVLKFMAVNVSLVGATSLTLTKIRHVVSGNGLSKRLSAGSRDRDIRHSLISTSREPVLSSCDSDNADDGIRCRSHVLRIGYISSPYCGFTWKGCQPL